MAGGPARWSRPPAFPTPEDDLLALSLWLTCAAIAESPAEPVAAPAVAPAATGDDDVVVAREEPTPPGPVPPFVLAGFLPDHRLALGAVLGLGTTFKSIDGDVEVLLRYRGVLAGVVVGGSSWSSNSSDIASIRTLGLEAGYAWAPGRYRLEGALGFGKATERREPAGVSVQSSGQFLRARLAGDRVLLGGEGWRVAAGAGAWWRRVQDLSWSPSEHQEFGVGLRLTGEVGW